MITPLLTVSEAAARWGLNAPEARDLVLAGVVSAFSASRRQALYVATDVARDLEDRHHAAPHAPLIVARVGPRVDLLPELQKRQRRVWAGWDGDAARRGGDQLRRALEGVDRFWKITPMPEDIGAGFVVTVRGLIVVTGRVRGISDIDREARGRVVDVAWGDLEDLPIGAWFRTERGAPMIRWSE